MTIQQLFWMNKNVLACKHSK